MTQFIASVTLIVPDYDQAIAFYVGLMGFELVEDHEISQDERRVLVAPPGSTETRLLLAMAENEAQEEIIGEQAADRMFLSLETYDLDGDLALMERAGVDIIDGPYVKDFGKILRWRDPFGNKWDLIERH